MNPQIQLSLEETDSVIISLNQHSIMEPKVIGFSVYMLKKQSFTETAPAAFFKKMKSTINSQYTNSRQVSHRLVADFHIHTSCSLNIYIYTNELYKKVRYVLRWSDFVSLPDECYRY